MTTSRLATRFAAPRGRARAISRDRGAALIEMVILIPAVLVLVFGIVQAALFYTARNTASSAAQVGLAIARAENGTIEQGTNATRGYLAQLGYPTGADVSGSRSATAATITVSLTAPAVLPGLTLPRVTATASAPVEALSS